MKSSESAMSSLISYVLRSYSRAMIGCRHAFPTLPKHGESMYRAFPKREDAPPLASLRSAVIWRTSARSFDRRFSVTSIRMIPSSRRVQSVTTPRYSLLWSISECLVSSCGKPKKVFEFSLTRHFCPEPFAKFSVTRSVSIACALVCELCGGPRVCAYRRVRVF